MTADEPQKKLARVNELDGVRAASILLVLAAHMLPLGPQQLQLNGAAGLMGMSLFFSLSGFLITRFLYDDKNIAKFLSRRIARIFPLMFLYAFVVALAVAGDFQAFAAMIFFYLNYYDAAFIRFNSHIWSLCVEFHFYISIAIAVGLMGRKAFYLLPIAAFIVFVLRVDSQTYYSIRTHLRIDEILAGGMLCVLWLNQQNRYSRWIIPALRRGFWIFAVFFFLSSHPIGGPLNYFRPYFGAALIGSVIFMQDGWIRQILRHAIPAYIAKVSYALYVWHGLSMFGWLGTGEKWELYLLKRPISFAMTFAMAHLSTFTIEKYFTDLVRGGTTSR